MNQQATLRATLLEHYRAPDYLVDKLELRFVLKDNGAKVFAKTFYRRVGREGAPLVLNGDELGVNSIRLDGKTVRKSSYELTASTLTIPVVPESFVLEIETSLCPEKNSKLEGLYRSSGTFCTQCEAEGFRRITWFQDRPDIMTVYTVRIEADRETCPVLLSNGNCIETGKMRGGRHFSVWQDPFPKPCYLFALVAGNLARVSDTYLTTSGRKVDLHIYVHPGSEDRCGHAMRALKNSMRWDEETYGREYDLDLFNIVAVDDFNAGAMENKSLNIFNARFVLAKSETATDLDFYLIESIVAHEYFHNWTGNRITCRDWFQLSLKEGLTVFRDQEFSGAMNSAAVKRIDDVILLREGQFVNDAGPMAHPVRPSSYIEISNFYTSTIYEKGAELLRMMHTLMGPELYRKGTDLYFDRHDGQAVTCDDFVTCMEDASELDFTQFKLWYSQAGTPHVVSRGKYDAKKKEYVLTLSQSLAETPGQPDKKPMLIPVAVGLLDRKGKDLLDPPTQVLSLSKPKQTFVFKGIKVNPVPSLLRGFSAPVTLETDITDETLSWLAANDSDGFNRWECGNTHACRILLGMVEAVQRGESIQVPDALIDAFRKRLKKPISDDALLAVSLTLPSENYLSQQVEEIDIEAIHSVRNAAINQLSKALKPQWLKLYQDRITDDPYSPDGKSMGVRALKNVALGYLMASGGTEMVALCRKQFDHADNMTEQFHALKLLANTHGPECEAALDAFYHQWQGDSLVINKWFGVQAGADREDVLMTVEKLLKHPRFSMRNPNRLRMMMRTYTRNLAHFHRRDGAGYRLLCDLVLDLDKLNPAIGANMLLELSSWNRYDPVRRKLMKSQLERVLETSDLSPDVYEVAVKTLADS